MYYMLSFIVIFQIRQAKSSEKHKSSQRTAKVERYLKGSRTIYKLKKIKITHNKV